MILVYIRGETPEDREFIAKMMQAAQIDNWQLRDLDVYDPADIPTDTAVAIGPVCARLVKQHVKNLYVIPSLDKLKPSKENKDHRRKAWSVLQDLANGAQPQTADDACAVLEVSGKKLCVYDQDDVPNIEADAFMSRTDMRNLLKLKEAIGAESIRLCSKDTSIRKGSKKNS